MGVKAKKLAENFFKMFESEEELLEFLYDELESGNLDKKIVKEIVDVVKAGELH